MKTIAKIIACTAWLWAGHAVADVEMKIITTKGYVAFTVADHWLVLQMQTKMPVAAAVFQLQNPADEGTPDSTNLMLLLFELGSEKEKTVYQAPVHRYGTALLETESFNDWKIYRQEAQKGKTTYSIWDAKKSGVADVSLSVRLAWPHLPNNSAGYAEEMERTFRAFLMSIWGGIGKYKTKPGEVTRRLTNDPQQGAPRDAPKPARP